ncbi:MAG: L,D-transpeptidase family protein, partial [Methylococcaceae bacterium]|nr:L,D-transpeptidase family protein [Methylococcaceae bacterium]
AMERLRWLPEPSAGASIIVNIPAFQLWAFDDIDEFDATMPNMRVVVGKALENQTPVLMAKMSFIDFMPYWNVPHNIVKKEILPKLMQNPGYLAGQNMELVTTFGNETKAVAFTGSSIAQLRQGTLRIRQRPGKKNALGKVKFIFPNKNDVYMHDTPSRSLFSKSRRDFSHGCVRVANPDQLAEFALKNQWSKETIQQALSTPKTRRVILKKSIPVTFFYVTSFIDQYNNLAFYSDIYGYDAVLQEALNNSGDLSDEAIFAPPAEPIPLDIPESIPVEAIKPREQIKPVEPIANYKML